MSAPDGECVCGFAFSDHPYLCSPGDCCLTRGDDHRLPAAVRDWRNRMREHRMHVLSILSMGAKVSS